MGGIELAFVEAVFVALLIGFPLLGDLMRRWLALICPMIGWPLFYAGLTQHWWGYGTGDGWQFVAAVATLAGVGSTALFISLGRAFSAAIVAPASVNRVRATLSRAWRRPVERGPRPAPVFGNVPRAEPIGAGMLRLGASHMGSGRTS